MTLTTVAIPWFLMSIFFLFFDILAICKIENYNICWIYSIVSLYYFPYINIVNIIVMVGPAAHSWFGVVRS